jgi:hypothetical protein
MVVVTFTRSLIYRVLYVSVIVRREEETNMRQRKDEGGGVTVNGCKVCGNSSSGRHLACPRAPPDRCGVPGDTDPPPP